MVAPGELCHNLHQGHPHLYPDGAVAGGSARPSVTSFALYLKLTGMTPEERFPSLTGQ